LGGDAVELDAEVVGTVADEFAVTDDAEECLRGRGRAVGGFGLWESDDDEGAVGDGLWGADAGAGRGDVEDCAGDGGVGGVFAAVGAEEEEVGLEGGWASLMPAFGRGHCAGSGGGRGGRWAIRGEKVGRGIGGG
jgi:hypothetical protein